MLRGVLARPGGAGLMLAVMTAGLVAFAVLNLKVEGDVARALKGTSQAFRTHSELEDRFGAPSKDEVFHVTADDLGAPDTYAAFEDLVLGLQLAPGVRGVLSIFTLPDPDGTGLTYLARSDLEDVPEAQRLDTLLARSPLAPYLLARDRAAALLTVIPDLDVPAGDRLAALEEEITLADPSLTVRSVGLAALQREISVALIADQARITPIATFLCVVIALVLFRSWRAAVLCAVPSLLGLGWTLAVMAALGIPFDPFMAIIPTLIIVLGIADSVHVFHAVMRHAETRDARRAIAAGLHETMPAVILAALTTALAFACLALVGSPTLANVALVGPIAMSLTTIAVYLALPPLTLLLFRRGPLIRVRPLEFRAVTAAALRLLPRHGAVTLATFAALALLVLAQTQTVIGYRLMDHVPRQGDFRATLEALRSTLPGSDQTFVILEAADPAPGISAADRALLDRAGAALYKAGAGLVPARDGPEADNAVLRRFEAADGSAFALPVIGPLDRGWNETLAAADATRRALDAAGLDGARIAGFSLMSSVELPLVVQELRFAFYVAVALVACLAALLLGSVRIAALSMVPNLLPILGVEAWLYLSDRPLTVTGAIAFTIAFGIAVDDTIHLLNRLRLARAPGAAIDRAAIEAALRATAAPILTTSLILLAGFTVTAFSLLPSVSVFGQLTAAAMLLAVIADLFLFPSLLCWGGIGARTR